MAAGLATGAFSTEQKSEDPFNLSYPNTADFGPLGDLDKLKAGGANSEKFEPRDAVRQALGPILLIYLLQQNRFSDGGNILQPVEAR